MDVLARKRDELGLTDTDIAASIGRSKSVVHRTLSGDPQYQGPKTVKLIAQHLGVEMSELIPDKREVA